MAGRITLSAFDQLKRPETQAVVTAARQYGEFHGLDVELSGIGPV